MADDAPDKPTGFLLRQVLYPDLYAWFVFVSALDLVLTWLVLHRGGREVNLLADFVIDRFGRGGIVTFKFGVVAFVVIACEWIGRRRRDLGRRLATWAIIIPSAAVGIAFLQLLTARE